MPFLFLVLLGCWTDAASQQIVKVPQSQAQVSRPDDLFALPPGQWHFAKRLWDGAAPCSSTECEGGYTSGDLVISAERAGPYVRIMVGFRSCAAVGHSEVEIGARPSKTEFNRVRKQVDRVVKGVAKTCKLSVPEIAPIDAAHLFPL